jgi:hypothetical protein
MSCQSRRAFAQMIVTAAVAGVNAPAVFGGPSADQGTSLPESNPEDTGYEADSFASGLADGTRALLGALQDTALDAFLTNWPAKPEWRRVVPSSLSVLRQLREVKNEAPAFSVALISELCRVAPRMAWRQSYNIPEVERAFLRNYGWSELVGLHGELASTRLACGFLLLGTATHYPRHRHEAEEIYVPLSGTAHWQQGDGVWREKQPGTVIHHASDESHAMRTSRQPLLAIYLWRSANLDQKAHLDPASA